MDNFGGEVTIRAGADGRVHVRADHASRDRVVLVYGGGSTLTVKAESRRGPPQSVGFDITVPRWMAVNVSGVYVDVSIDGTEGEVTVETVQGEVSCVGGKGFIVLQSVEGAVTVRGARGRVEATSVNDLFRHLAELTGFPGSPTYGPRRPGDLRHFYLDCAKANNELAWPKPTPLAKGLAETVAWFRQKVAANKA